ncbi:hypothetical protein EVA_14436, partial [gut metagenome]
SALYSCLKGFKAFYVRTLTKVDQGF